MGQETAIEWCHHTLNIFRGCAKVHAGCTNCYAEKNVGVRMNGITWGEVWQGGQRVVMAESGWRQPLKWARDAARAGERRRVFCSSLADVLEVPTVPDHLGVGSSAWNDATARVAPVAQAMEEARGRLWDTIRQTVTVLPDGTQGSPETGIAGYPGLDWLLLTKRPENWELVPEDVRQFAWLGTSISDQQTADEWVPRLLASRGFRVRFLSVEPLVRPVDLSRWLERIDHCGGCGAENAPQEADRCPACGAANTLIATWGAEQARRYHSGARYEEDGPGADDDGPQISWVIVGGESGSKARPCNVEWVRSIVRQCREAQVPCFVKQVGARPVGLGGHGDFAEHMDPKGGMMEQWPPDIRVRELPQAV